MHFWSIYVSDKTTQPSQKPCNLYILEEHFIGYHVLYTKPKKLFLFLRNRLFSNTLTFASFCWDQRNLISGYGSKLYTIRLYLTGSTSWSSFMIRALAKLDLLKIKKTQTLSKFFLFDQFPEVVGPHSQAQIHVIYMYSESKFYWLSYPFYKTRKTVFVLEK